MKSNRCQLNFARSFQQVPHPRVTMSMNRASPRRFISLPCSAAAYAIALLVLVLGSPTAVAAEPENVDWPVYLGGKGRRLYSPLKQITRENVSQLEVAWTYETGDQSEYQANNLIVDGLRQRPARSSP
jgi:hypothetical protein